MPPRASADPIDPQKTAALLRTFFETYPQAAILEHGTVLFDMRAAQWSLNTDHDRCTLHLWSAERNLTRRVLSAEARSTGLRLSVQRFGQPKPSTLDLVSKQERRLPTTRDAARRQYLRTLERVLVRNFPEWKPAGFSTAMDLERSFGPA